MTKENKRDLYNVFKEALRRAFPILNTTFDYPVEELEEVINASIYSKMYSPTELPTVDELREELNNG